MIIRGMMTISCYVPMSARLYLSDAMVSNRLDY